MATAPNSVSLSGTEKVGNTLTATVQGTPDSGYSAQFEWQRSANNFNWITIVTSGSNTYSLVKADAYNYIRVIVNYVKSGSADSDSVVSSSTVKIVIDKEATPNAPTILTSQGDWGTPVKFFVIPNHNYRLLKSDNITVQTNNNDISLISDTITATKSITVGLQAQKKGSSTTENSDWSTISSITFDRKNQSITTPTSFTEVWGTLDISGKANNDDGTGKWIYQIKSTTADNSKIDNNGNLLTSSSGAVSVNIAREQDDKYNAPTPIDVSITVTKRESEGKVSESLKAVKENSINDLNSFIVGKNDQVVKFTEKSDVNNIGTLDSVTGTVSITDNSHGKAVTYEIDFEENKKYKSKKVLITFTVDRLDVIVRYNNLVEASLGPNSVYDATTKYIEKLTNEGTITTSQRAEVLTNIMGAMVNAITTASIQGALSWAEAEKNNELVDSKIRESYAATHKLVADTYINYGNFSYTNLNENGIDGVTANHDSSHKTLSDAQFKIATMQAKGYAWNGWANNVSGSASLLGTAVGLGTDDFTTDGSVGKTVLDNILASTTNLKNIKEPD